MAALRPPLEEHTGFEPAVPAWKAGVLPLTPMLRITAGLSMSGGAGLCLLSAKKKGGIHFGSLPFCHGGQSRIRTGCLLLCLQVCFRKHLLPVSPPPGRQSQTFGIMWLQSLPAVFGLHSGGLQGQR